MDHTADWQLSTGTSTGTGRTQSHVQAWARDSLTGEPVYIMELGEQRRGGKCGCECQSCDLPLTAVNAAKSEYIKRPHFRHPNGAEKSECMFLAARLAALQLLREQGVFELPARRVSGKVLGLSGTQHEVWIEHPAERIKIRDFDFRDKASALITLDDGRQLRFHLIGSGNRSEDGHVTPSVFLDLSDAALAGMSLEELRKRTTLVPDGLCWQSHWRDAELQNQADQAALAKAVDLMDIEGEYITELEGVELKFRRETLLHLEVKRILSESRQIRVPEVQCYVLRTADDGHEIEHSFDFPSQVIPLTAVTLEKRFGRLIPDVTAQTSADHGDILLIEVTVTNTIRQERHSQIRTGNVPAIEIDIGRTGGMISRSELRDLVIDSTECKRWLCHPEADLRQNELEQAADAKLQELNWAIQDRAAARLLVLNTPVEVIARDYLDAIQQYQALARNGLAADFEEISRLLKEIDHHADRLATHGFHEAKDSDLIGTRSQIVPRILAIKNGGGVGYELDSTMGIMNAIKQTQAQNRKFHTIYLIAEAVYRKNEARESPTWYQSWVQEIKRSIEDGGKMYVRPRRYDELLSLLFPEMRSSLMKSFGTEDYVPKHKEYVARKNDQNSGQRLSPASFWPWDQESRTESFWLKGRELEQWKRNHPSAASDFFGVKKGSERDE